MEARRIPPMNRRPTRLRWERTVALWKGALKKDRCLRKGALKRAHQPQRGCEGQPKVGGYANLGKRVRNRFQPQRGCGLHGLRDAVHNRLWGWKGRGGYPGLAPLQGANFFRRSYRGLRCAGPRLFTRAPSGLSLFPLRMAKLQNPPMNRWAIPGCPFRDNVKALNPDESVGYFRMSLTDKPDRMSLPEQRRSDGGESFMKTVQEKNARQVA